MFKRDSCENNEQHTLFQEWERRSMAIEQQHNKIVFTRTFEAPVQAVYQAYTDRTQFEQWFHPEGATTEVYQFDVKPGGRAFFAIKAPQGTSYTVMKYNKVVPHQCIDYYDYFADEKGNVDKNMIGMHNIIELKDLSDRTELTSTAVLPTETAAKKLLEMGVEAGMESTFDHLEQLLARN